MGKNTFLPLGGGKSPAHTSRREAESPEDHLAAANGLEPIQATEARGTADEEETDSQGTRKPFWGHRGGVHRKLGRLQSEAKHWVSKKVLEVEGGTQFLHKHVGPPVAYRWTHGWYGRGSPIGHASLSSKRRQASPNRTRIQLLFQSGNTAREVPQEQHLSHGGRSRKRKLSRNNGLPRGRPALAFMSCVWTDVPSSLPRAD